MNTNDIRRAIAKGHPVNSKTIGALCDDYDKARKLLKPAKDRIEGLGRALDATQASNRDLWRNRSRLLWLSVLGAAVVAGMVGVVGGFVLGLAVGGG